MDDSARIAMHDFAGHPFQLLRGEMSIVHPRPKLLAERDAYAEILE